ncbi:MAG: hypothetical protein LH613_00040 [Chamaesiphon sp.]|nr:hypothetical protein [Chamaesiphon sp.]
MILVEGKIAKSAIDLSSAATAAISHWLALRDSCNGENPMFISLSQQASIDI